MSSCAAQPVEPSPSPVATVECRFARALVTIRVDIGNMATAAAAGLDDEAVRLALVTAQHGADLVAIADEVGVEDPVARELGMHGSAVMSAYQDVTSPEMLYADDVLIQAAQNVSAGTPALLALLPRDALAGCGL